MSPLLTSLILIKNKSINVCPWEMVRLWFLYPNDKQFWMLYQFGVLATGPGCIPASRVMHTEMGNSTTPPSTRDKWWHDGWMDGWMHGWITVCETTLSCETRSLLHSWVSSRRGHVDAHSPKMGKLWTLSHSGLEIRLTISSLDKHLSP